MLTVVKRDGTEQKFSSRKIGSVLGAVLDGSGSVQRMLERVVDRVSEKDKVTVGEISDIVESVLVDAGFIDEARSFIRYRAERDRMRAERGRADVQAFADSIVASKYTKVIDGKREKWEDAVDRYISMHRVFWHKRVFAEGGENCAARFDAINALLDECVGPMKERRVVGSMRGLQMGGAKILKHNDSLYNCCFTHISSMEAICKAFFRLLCGCGVGYSVQFRHVDQLPDIMTVDRSLVHHHTVEDSIEGWVDALRVLLESYTVPGRNSFVEFNYSSVRGEGSLLRTTGGTAPGHLGLKKGLEEVRSILDGCLGRLRPIHCHDIMCWIASAVLSGGVRRSAMLALFSPTDGEMMMAKSPGYFAPQIPGSLGQNAQREYANNSVCFDRSRVERSEFDRVLGLCRSFGEPGFYFTDDPDMGPNPCGEINMLPLTDGTDNIDSRSMDSPDSGFGFCNLTEINGAMVRGRDDFLGLCRLASVLGTLQAGYTGFKWPEDSAIAERDALLGVSIMGIMNQPDLLLDGEVLRDGAAVVRETNSEVAAVLGIRTGARLTCVKPSGTASKACSTGEVVGAGIHPLWSRRWIQGVTYKKSEPVLQHILRYSPVQVTWKPNGDAFVEWPLSCSDSAVTLKNVDALGQLHNISKLYKNWVQPGTVRGNATHNVSCTVTVRDDEWASVSDYIWKNRTWLAALTFVPDLLEIKYPYAPYRAVRDRETEGRFNELVSEMRPIDWTEFVTEENKTLEPACAGGACDA